MARAVSVALLALPFGCTAILAADDLTFRDSSSAAASGSGGVGGSGSSSTTATGGASASSGTGGSGGSQCIPTGSIPAPSALWSKPLGSTDQDKGFGVAFIGTNVVVAGSKRLDWAPTTCVGFADKGGSDAFYAQLDSMGTCSTLSALGGDATDLATSIVASGTSLIVVAGQTEYSTTGDFTGSTLNPGGNHAFAANVGTVAPWKRAFNTAGGDSAVVAAAVDSNNNVILTGYFIEAIDFACPGSLSSQGIGYNVFVAKLDATGTCAWSRAVGDKSPNIPIPDARGRGVATDGSGNIFVTGSFNDALDFLQPATPVVTTPFMAMDVFVAKLDSQGNAQWSKQGLSPDQAHGYAIAFDPSDNSLVVVGDFNSDLHFGAPCNPMSLPPGVATGPFVAKLDAGTGACVWAKHFDGWARANSVAVDGCGNVVITGSVIDVIDFGGGMLPPSGSPDGSDDVFVLKLDKAGNHVWSRRGGGNDGSQRGYAIATDPNGNIAVTGAFTGTLNFGGGQIQALPSGMGTPTDDVFVAVFPPQ